MIGRVRLLPVLTLWVFSTFQCEKAIIHSNADTVEANNEVHTLDGEPPRLDSVTFYVIFAVIASFFIIIGLTICGCCDSDVEPRPNNQYSESSESNQSTTDYDPLNSKMFKGGSQRRQGTINESDTLYEIESIHNFSLQHDSNTAPIATASVKALPKPAPNMQFMEPMSKKGRKGYSPPKDYR